MTLNLRTSTSSKTFPLLRTEDLENDAKDFHHLPFYIQIHVSIKSTTRPGLPVTLATWRTPLERENDLKPQHIEQQQNPQASEDEEMPISSPVWLNSALTPLRSTTDPSKRAAPPALGWVTHRRGGFSRDLRESWDFITVPPDGRELIIKHFLPRKVLRFYRKGGEEGDAQPEKGERFVIGPSANALGTFWWRWGDLNGDLANKKFRSDDWYDGKNDGGNQELAVGEEGLWLESEGVNGFGLTMEVENEAEVEFV